MSIGKFAQPGIDEGFLETFERFYGAPRLNVPVTARAKYGRSVQLSESAKEDSETLEIATVQHALRPLFGKGAPLAPTIGDHPDFRYLKGTDDTCQCGITTMFMDIEGSTRFCLLYDLDEVRRIKNAFIQTAIHIIRAFDGHVHRIMGDAVMGYFGGRNQSPESGVIDCLNCSAALQYFVEYDVKPKLRAWGFDDEFGVRVGIDYGPDDKVLWGSYGAPGIEEVTATSFHVDVAAKLQQAASRNQAMLGGSIVDVMDIPEKLLEMQTEIREGSQIPRPYVMPNYRDENGRPINYRQWQFRAGDYLLCTPFGQRSQKLIGSRLKPIPVTAHIYNERGGACLGEYQPASRALRKGQWLKYSFRFPDGLVPTPYKVRCEVENHGREAGQHKDNDDHSHDYVISDQSKYHTFEHWEHTQYRGLHYLTMKVFVREQLTHQTRFGVYIE